MIWVAMILEVVQSIRVPSHWTDFGVLAGLQLINGVVAFYEEKNAGNAIDALKQSLAPRAVVKRDGRFVTVKARELVPGDLVALKLGVIVPGDCRLLKPGKPMEVDQAALTGESLPVTKQPGEELLMGSTIVKGELDAIITKTGANTFFGRAAAMVGSVEQVGRFQKVLFNVMMFLMGIAICLVAVILVVLLRDTKLTSDNIINAVGIAVVLLVASIPIAMQVVATVTMAVGARRLAAKKAIVARLSAIEELAGMDCLCSDKTGTLTQNKLTLYDPIMIDDSEQSKEPGYLNFIGALAAKRQEEGQDAIDFCIVRAAEKDGYADRLRSYEELDFTPFDPVIKRVEAKVRSPNGEEFWCCKGAPQVVLNLSSNCEQVRDRVEGAINDLASRGYRSLGVAKTNQQGKWMFLGVLSLFDPPRVDTERTIKRALKMGITVKMVTGDQTAIAKETARNLGMGSRIYAANEVGMGGGHGHGDASHGAKENDIESATIKETTVEEMDQDTADLIRDADGFAEVFPEHKFKIVQVLQDRHNLTTGMTGDGVNDAPALKRANIGIAVEGATDAARAAADIVLTEPGLSVIIDAMIMSRKIFQRVRNYCIFRISGTIQLIFFFFVAVFFNPQNNFAWPDSFVGDEPKHLYLPVIAIVLITLLNDACVITIARDNVVPNAKPQPWDLPQVFAISTILGTIACTGSLLLLTMAFDAGDKMHDSRHSLSCLFFQDTPDDNCQLNYPQLLTVVYLKLSITDCITVFTARTRGFFWERRPGVSLMIAAVVATGASTFIAVTAQLDASMGTISWRLAGMVWAYCIIWFLIQDVFKVIGYKAYEKIQQMRGEQPSYEEVPQTPDTYRQAVMKRAQKGRK
jgi:H+-transporting ATPase